MVWLQKNMVRGNGDSAFFMLIRLIPVYRCTAYAVQLTIFGFTADKLYWRNIKKESISATFRMWFAGKSLE